MPLDYTVFGGEVPKTHERNLSNGYAAVARDVDLARGTLRPFATDRVVDETNKSQRTLLVEDCAIQASGDCVSFARTTIPCLRYFRAGVAGHPEQSAGPGTPWHRLGFPVISRPPTVTYPNGTPLTTDKVIERRYLYAYRDIYGQLSQGSAPSAPVTADWDARAVISGFIVPPAEYPVVSIVLYTTVPGVQTDEVPKADSNSFFQIAEFPISTLAYEHSPLTTNIGELYMNQSFYEPPTDLSEIRHWGTNQLVGISDGKLMFSQPMAYHAWPIDYTIMPASPALTVVATENFGYILTCGMPEVVNLKHDCQGGKCHETAQITEQLPVLSIRSAVAHDDSALYASKDGLVMLTRNRVRVITANLFTQEQWLAIHPNTMVGVVHDGFYIGCTDNYAFRLRIPDEAYENNPLNLLVELSLRATAFYRSSDDRLYFSDRRGIWEWGAGVGYKPYYWRGRVENIDARRGMGASEIDVDGTVTVRYLKSGRVTWERIVVGNRCFRVPPYVRGGDLQVEVTGTGEVSRVKIAASKSVISGLQ